MEQDAALAQDLCARLCHDLVGPLGTVAGAIDLLGEDPEAAELARDAAAVLRRRLKFWRAACGAGTGPLSVQEALGLLEGLPAGGRATLRPEGLAETEVLGAAEAQLLLAAAMLAGEALPRGGVVRLLRHPGGGLAVLPEGRGAAWPAALEAVLSGAAEPGPRTVLAAMLGRLALLSGWEVLLLPPGEGPASAGEAAAALLLTPRG